MGVSGIGHPAPNQQSVQAKANRVLVTEKPETMNRISKVADGCGRVNKGCRLAGFSNSGGRSVANRKPKTDGACRDPCSKQYVVALLMVAGKLPNQIAVSVERGFPSRTEKGRR